MTKDELTTKFIDLSEKNIQALDGLKEAIGKINDTNTLHAAKTAEVSKHVDKLVTSVEIMSKMFSKILWVLVLAIVILAGAEKVLKFM